MEQDIQKAESEMLSIDVRCREIAEAIAESEAQSAQKKQLIDACRQQMAEYYKSLEELSQTSEGQQQKSAEIREEIARLSEQKNNLRMEKISVETQLATLQAHKEEVLATVQQKEPEVL